MSARVHLSFPSPSADKDGRFNAWIPTTTVHQIQSGSATCSEGFVQCFIRVTQAISLYYSCHAAQASKLNFQKTFYKTFGSSCRPDCILSKSLPCIDLAHLRDKFPGIPRLFLTGGRNSGNDHLSASRVGRPVAGRRGRSVPEPESPRCNNMHFIGRIVRAVHGARPSRTRKP